MTRLWEIFRFEVGFQLARVSTRLYFAIFVAFALLLAHAIVNDARNDGYYFNAPIVTALLTSVAGMLSLLVTCGVAGDAATRDAEVRIHSLLYSTPLRKASYLGGRFLGAFAITALLMLAVPAGLLLATSLPGIEPQILGPFRAEAYLTAYFAVAVPNAFMATAVLFALAAITGRAIAAYGGAMVLFFSPAVTEGLIGEKLGRWDLARLLDPLAYTPLHALFTSYNPLQKNMLLVPLEGAVLSNRLLWLGVGAAVLALAHLRFRFAYETGGGRWRRAVTVDDAPASRWTRVTVPAARRTFGAATRMRQLRSITMQSFRELVISKAWLIVPVTALLAMLSAAEVLEVELGVPGPATTGRVAELLDAEEAVRLLAILIAISAGELVWRERGARIHAIADVTPVPEWLSFLGKLLALGLMLLLSQTIFLATGAAVQAMLGFPHLIDAGLYVRILFGDQLSRYLIFAALAMCIHVLVNQKYFGNVLAILAFVATQLGPELGIEHNLLLYGGAPEWSYSQMSGFGPQRTAWRWFTFYWSGWALLCAVVTYLFWIRGEERGARTRLMLARRRLTRGPATIGARALAIVAGAGGFAFYNTNVLNRYDTDAEYDARSADYERRYGRYASLPQPLLAATKLQVDFHPQRAAAGVRGSYRLVNRNGVPIESIHVVSNPGVRTESIAFDRPARLAHDGPEHGYRIYALATPLQPGASLRMDFALRFAPRGFTNNGRNASVVANGSWFQHRADHAHGPRQWLPFVGYQRSRELDNPLARRDHGLRERPPFALLEDAAARNDGRGREKIELETIIGTDADQIGVAPGTLRRTWRENGRQYAHYVTEVPITNSYAIYSARYAVHRARWRNVPIEVYHHPAHTANLARIVRGVQASLDYHTKHYSPYPYRQVRLVEYPSSGRGLGLTSFPGLIEYSEAFALVRPEHDARRIDFPFAIMAHEMGHQWFGHQLVPALVEGAPVLSESLAWYSAMLVIEETFGREHLQRLLDIMRSQYLAPHETRNVPLLRTFDRLDAYRTGPFAMYALREAVGAGRVNAALRTLLSKFDPASPPYPVSLDLYAELRATTPPDRHSLLKDLFEEITFWQLETKKVEAVPAGNGSYRVTLHVAAQKLKADALGKEKPVPMNDVIEVAVFAADGEAIYRAPHRIRSGAQTITVTVPRAPARAGVDPDHELLDRKPEDNEAEAGEK